MTRVRIDRGFWMSKFEVTNRQFREFDPNHDRREEDRDGDQFAGDDEVELSTSVRALLDGVCEAPPAGHCLRQSSIWAWPATTRPGPGGWPAPSSTWCSS